MAEDENNRVTTREFYAELKEMRKDMAEMERRILAKLDTITGEFPTRHEFNDLKTKSNRVDAIIGTVTVLGSLLAAALGIRQQ